MAACPVVLGSMYRGPGRAKVVPGLAALDRYPWTGHSALIGRVPRRFQAAAEVLGAFGQKVGSARRRYRQFVAEGLPQGRRSRTSHGRSGYHPRLSAPASSARPTCFRPAASAPPPW